MPVKLQIPLRRYLLRGQAVLPKLDGFMIPPNLLCQCLMALLLH